MYVKLLCASVKTNPNISSFIFRRNHSKLISPGSYESFESCLPTVIDKISRDKCFHPNVTDRFKKITECISYEDKFRGPLSIHAYESFASADNISEKSLNQIRTLAWAVEMVNSYFMMLDDLDKNKETIWCHYDPSLLRSCLYQLLKIDLDDQILRGDIVELFDKAFLYSTIGQHLNITSRKDYKNFTPERYKNIVDLRTTFLTFKLPVFLAMKLANVTKDSYTQVEELCEKLGRLYHIQTDYLDCYGEELDQCGIPKHSCDIQQGKCSWLALTALQRCSPAQRIVFTACYGSNEPAHVERIKLLYDRMEMPEAYKHERERMCDYITLKIKGSGLNLFARVLEAVKDRDQIKRNI